MRSILLAGFAVFLTGCTATNAAYEAQQRDGYRALAQRQCAAQGLRPGSGAYQGCVNRLYQQRVAHQAAENDEARRDALMRDTCYDDGWMGGYAVGFGIGTHRPPLGFARRFNAICPPF